jgi:hypothetical protein
MHLRLGESEPVGGGSAVQPSSEVWYCQVLKKPTTSVQSVEADKLPKSLSRDCGSCVTPVGVVITESAVGIPRRRVFRYAGTDINFNIFQSVA